MLKRLGILFLCLLLAFKTKASVDYYAIVALENTVFCASPYTHLSDGDLSKILILNEVLKEYNSNNHCNKYLRVNVQMYNSYISDCLFAINPKYFLGIDKHLFIHDENRKAHYHTKDAVTININTNHIDIKECISLLLYALNNDALILKHQIPILAKSGTIFYKEVRSNYDFTHTSLFGNFDIIHSISQNETNRLTQNIDSSVTKTLGRKYFDIEYYTPELPRLSFYYQNDTYYFYKRHHRVSDGDTNKVLFSNNKMYRTVDDEKRNNHFVFITVDSFYHINSLTGNVNGPFLFEYVDSLYLKSSYKGISNQLNTKGDSAIFTLLSDYGEYKVIFRYSDKTIIIDSSSFSEGINLKIQRVLTNTHPSQKTKPIDNAFAMRKYYALILVCFVVVLNLFLAFSKKL